jgi:voltage-gated potassium channel
MGVKEVRSSETWAIAMGGLRALVTASVLVALYYLLPFESRVSSSSTIVKLGLGLAVFVGLMTWQVRAIEDSANPALRALEGLFLAVPLFLLIFASTYFLMSRSDPSTFTSALSRTDALYFTVTIFSTVGFGDISAQAETARLVVTGQMMLDLVILGVGVRIILGAVERGRDRLADDPSDPAT